MFLSRKEGHDREREARVTTESVAAKMFKRTYWMCDVNALVHVITRDTILAESETDNTGTYVRPHSVLTMLITTSVLHVAFIVIYKNIHMYVTCHLHINE